MSEDKPYREPRDFSYYNTAGEYIKPGSVPPPAASSRLTRVTSYGIEIIDQSAPDPTPTAPEPPTSAPRRRTRKAS